MILLEIGSKTVWSNSGCRINHLNAWDEYERSLRKSECLVLAYFGLVIYRARKIHTSQRTQSGSQDTETDEIFRDLIDSLASDGWVHDGVHLVASGRMEIDRIRKLVPRPYLNKVENDLKLIASTVDSVPAHAIGASKNLLETISKIVMRELGVKPTQQDPNLQQLVSEAFKALREPM